MTCPNFLCRGWQEKADVQEELEVIRLISRHVGQIPRPLFIHHHSPDPILQHISISNKCLLTGTQH